MADIWHEFGGDLSLSATGDLLLATGSTETQQRILRRLLTNPLDYIWHVKYGAGLRQQVGQTASLMAITSTIRSQIFAEKSVAQTPAPTVAATQDATGDVSVTITYADASTNLSQTLSFKV